MTDDGSVQELQQRPGPSPDLQGLDRLVGTWQVTGGAEGTVTYEWLDGGFFLLQQVELEQYGQRVKGIEVIGRLQPFGEEPSDDIWSRYYDSMGTRSTTSTTSMATR
jgi:hypothetical protein